MAAALCKFVICDYHCVALIYKKAVLVSVCVIFISMKNLFEVQPEIFDFLFYVHSILHCILSHPVHNLPRYIWVRFFRNSEQTYNLQVVQYPRVFLLQIIILSHITKLFRKCTAVTCM